MATTVLDQTNPGGNSAESRLSIHEVPEQISRIFFGKPEVRFQTRYNNTRRCVENGDLAI